MRPIIKKHSAIRHPLDTILGSEGNVRLLRVFLQEVRTSLGSSDAARLAGLTPAGARKALGRLLDAGVLEHIGSGRTLQYKLCGNGPLIQALEQLFDREREQHDAFVLALKKALAGFTEIRAAWFGDTLEGSGQPVEMCVVADAHAVDWVGEELRTRLKDVEQEFDLIVETKILTRADAPVPSPGVTFLISMDANTDAGRKPPSSHGLKEERSLRMAQEIVKMMRSDPTLITRALHHVNRLLHDEQGTATAAITEWRQILETYSSRQLRQLLVSTSSRATRLRQSSPFFAVLTAEERDTLVASIQAP